MNTKKKVAVVFAFVIIAVIFGIFAYLVIKMENEKHKEPNVASLTDAGTKLVSMNDYISTEAPTTEEITTEEPTTQQITTEATTEKVTEAPTTEVATEATTEELYSEEYDYVDYGYYEESEYHEEETYEPEPEPETEEYVEDDTNDYIPEDSNDDGMSYYTSSWTTAYAWTDNTCADGRWPELGYTAASSDPNLWNKWIYIDGVGEFYIHDYCPTSGVIDIYMGDEATCVQYGSSVRDIYIIDR